MGENSDLRSSMHTCNPHSCKWTGTSFQMRRHFTLKIALNLLIFLCHVCFCKVIFPPQPFCQNIRQKKKLFRNISIQTLVKRITTRWQRVIFKSEEIKAVLIIKCQLFQLFKCPLAIFATGTKKKKKTSRTIQRNGTEIAPQLALRQWYLMWPPASCMQQAVGKHRQGRADTATQAS